MYTFIPSDEAQRHVEALRAHLPEVRAFVREHVPRHWPLLADVLTAAMDEPLAPPALLPLASCSAVGGDPVRAIPASASWTVMNLGVRLLDDAQDRDRPDALWAEIGPARAFNLSAALYALSLHLLATSYPAALHHTLVRTVTAESLRLAAGQDRDLSGAASSLTEHWMTFEEKNARLFALACQLGALCGTEEPSLVEACARYGHHLGNVLQVFDDVQGLWEPEGIGDLDMEKSTLPLYYGLSFAHEGREQLAAWKDAGALHEHAEAIRALLDAIDTREFMVWTALQERERACAALSVCPGEYGVQALIAYVTRPFADIESIAPSTATL